MKRLLLSLVALVGIGRAVMFAAVADNTDDFNTFNGGSANSGYSTYTTTDGWTAKNSAIVKIGSDLAPTLNGKTSAVGTLTSPTLIGGLKTLSFSYVNTFSESNGASLRIDIKQNGSVVGTETLTNTSMTSNQLYTFTSKDFDVTGNFTIEITNLSPSKNSSSNKDRVSILNLSWVSQEGTSGGGDDPIEPEPEGDVYEVIKSLNDITKDGEYIWVTQCNNKIYGMSNTASGSKFTGTEISGNLNDGILVRNEDIQILNTPSINGNSIVWQSGSQYLLGQGNGTNLTLNAQESTSTVSIDDNGVATIGYPITSGNARMILYNNNNNYNQFGHYAQSNANTSGYYNIYICKKQEGGEPGTPVVTLDGVALTSDGSQIVLKDSSIELDITCKNATSIYINGEKCDLQNDSYKYNVNTTEEGEVSLSIQGYNEEGYGPEFTYTFIVDIKEEIPGTNFKQMLLSDDLSEGYYVIAKVNGTEDGVINYAMKNELGNGNIRSTTQISAQALDRGGSLITIENEEVLVVKLIEQDNQWGIKTVNLGDGFSTSQGYIYALDESSISLSIDKENFRQAFISHPQGSNNININFASDSGRKIVLASNNDYFNYQANGTIQLYQYTNLNKFDPNFTDQKLKSGEKYTIEFPADCPNITLTVEGNTDAITINGNEITANDYISSEPAVIKAKWDEDENWFGGEASFNVNVIYKADLSFRHGTDPENPVRGKLGVGVISQAAYYTGDGNIVYSSSDPLELIVDKETGMIRPEDILYAKVDKLYTITAHVEGETGSYVEGDAKYYIIIEKSEEGITNDVEYMIEDFRDENKASINNSDHWYQTDEYTLFREDSYSNDISYHKSKKTGIEYTMRTALYTQYKNQWFIQFAAKNNSREQGYLSFSIPENCVSITFMRGEGENENTNMNALISIEDVVTDAQFSYGKSGATYVFDGDYSGKTMKIATGTNALSFARIIYNIAVKDNTNASSLSFDISNEDGESDPSKRIINMFEGETVQLPKLLHNEDLSFADVELDIDEIDEMDEDENFQNYVIDRSAESYDNINVTVYNTGVYTFRAKYEGKDFLNSMAILRLNVFPRLSVLPSDDQKLADDVRTDAPDVTIVHADESGATATINLPNIEELNDAFKYSTVTLDKVIVKHGDNEPVELTPEEYAEGAFVFEEDGWVEYKLVYAGTDDFSVSSRVNVVMVPTTPICEPVLDGSGHILSLASQEKFNKNAKLQYRVISYQNAQGPTAVARRNEGADAEGWITVDSPYTFTNEDIQSQGIREIEYRSAKDIAEVTKADGEDYLGSLTDTYLLEVEPIEVTVSSTEGGVGTFRNVNDERESVTAAFMFINNDDGKTEQLTIIKDFTLSIAPKDDTDWVKADDAEGATAIYNKLPDGLKAQYGATSAGAKVDGVYVPFTISAEYESEAYNVTGDFPCSGVYTVTISPVDGSQYSFEEATVDITVCPNLLLMYGDIPGLNVNGFGFTLNGGDATINYPYYSESNKELWQPNETDEKGVTTIFDSFVYTPGIYFATGLEIDTSHLTQLSTDEEESNEMNRIRKANEEVDDNYYGGSVSLAGFTGGSLGVTITKNGASSEKTWFSFSNFNSETGIEGIGEEDGEAVYYNLQGVRVQNPERGIYVKVQNGKATKVLR